MRNMKVALLSGSRKPGVLLFLTGLMTILTGVSVEAQNSKKKHDTISVSQRDGSTLKIVGFGTTHVSYTETVDGYTVVRNNKGVYEYAEQTSNGDLEAGGVQAHNPGERKEDEKRYLSRMDKHLRYQPPKLDELKEKHDRLYRIFED